MNKKIVYHGTTIDRAKKILDEGIIKNTENDRYIDTTKGFVYVTERLCDALDFSTRPNINTNRMVFAVFRILIDEAELIHDEDEEKWNSTLSVDGKKFCYRISKSLIVGREVVAFWHKKMKSDRELGEFMQSIQYGEKTIDESEWEILCHD